jgi:hypothetical protein
LSGFSATMLEGAFCAKGCGTWTPSGWPHTCAETPVAAAPALTLEAVLALMQRFGATRVRTPEGLDVSLPAPAPQPQAEPLPSATAQPYGEPVCKCGHPLQTEHNETGCLRGCRHDECAEAPADA